MVLEVILGVALECEVFDTYILIVREVQNAPVVCIACFVCRFVADINCVMDRFVECYCVSADSLDLMVLIYLYTILDDVMVCTKFACGHISVLKLKSNIVFVVVLY